MLDDGPHDPFADDPDDPAALLEEADGPAGANADARDAGELSEEERADLLADLEELTEFRRTLEPRGIAGISVECSDCGESHFFGWELMASNLRALLGTGRTHVHEPAYDPDPEAYVSWDYARGYTDAASPRAGRQR